MPKRFAEKFQKKFQKKSLGQNFLKNPGIAADMVRAGEVRPGDTVVEVGPGKGTLTQALLEAGARVVAIEKDDRLISYLQEKFEKEIKNKKLEIIHSDALEFTPTSDKLQVTSYKLVANIPYYITGAIIRHFLTLERQPQEIALLVQKEVAERIVAKDGKESILSISVKAYGEPVYVKTVKRGNFSPAPKVDSAILAIKNISRKNFTSVVEEQKFFELMKAGFAQKRKLLVSNLAQMVFKKDVIEKAFAQCNIPSKARAENLTIEQWKCLIVSFFASI